MTKNLGTIVSWKSNVVPQGTILSAGMYPATMGPSDALHRAMMVVLRRPRLKKLNLIGYAITSASPDGDYHVRIKNDISIYISGLTIEQSSKSGDLLSTEKMVAITKAYQYLVGCVSPADLTREIEQYVYSRLSIRMGTRCALVTDASVLTTLEGLHNVGAIQLRKYTLAYTEENKQQAIEQVVEGLISEAAKIAEELEGKHSGKADTSRHKRANALEAKLEQYEKLFNEKLTSVSTAINQVRAAVTKGVILGNVQDEYQDALDAICGGIL
tara:strand:+ start:2524 stop:3336 length:813 start_codon:yes stop_codon:yes gene_type:complete